MLEFCCPLHTRIAVMRTAGNFSFCRSVSGKRQRTPNVSGLTPGGSGVGTPGLIGSLMDVLVAVVRDLFTSETDRIFAACDAAVVSGRVTVAPWVVAVVPVVTGKVTVVPVVTGKVTVVPVVTGKVTVVPVVTGKVAVVPVVTGKVAVVPAVSGKVAVVPVVSGKVAVVPAVLVVSGKFAVVPVVVGDCCEVVGSVETGLEQGRLPVNRERDVGDSGMLPQARLRRRPAVEGGTVVTGRELAGGGP